MDTIFVLSSLGTIGSVASSITPILAIYEKSKTKSLHEIPFAFLLVNHSCQFLWLFYSIMLSSTELLVVNLLTTFLSLISLIIYFFYSGKITQFIPAYISTVFIFTLVVFALFDTETVGLICLISTLATITASTESLKNAITYQNSNYIDLNMNLSGAFNSAIWTLFGNVTNNFNVVASSGYGLIVSGLMIIAYYYFREVKKID